MSSPTASRAGAAAGVAFVVALMSLTTTGSESSAVLAGEVLALLLFVPFLAYLCGLLRDAEGAVPWLSATAFAAGLVAITVKVVSVIPASAARLDGHSAPVERALERLSEIAFIVSLPPLGICLAAVAAVVIRTAVLPVWLGWAAAATAPLLVVNGFALESEFGPAFLLFLLWTLVAAVVLLRRALSPGAERSTRAPTLTA